MNQSFYRDEPVGTGEHAQVVCRHLVLRNIVVCVCVCVPHSFTDSIMVSLIGFVQLVIHWNSCWVTNNRRTRYSSVSTPRPIRLSEKTHLAHGA